jgi:hypothetical protein
MPDNPTPDARVNELDTIANELSAVMTTLKNAPDAAKEAAKKETELPHAVQIGVLLGSLSIGAYRIESVLRRLAAFRSDYTADALTSVIDKLDAYLRDESFAPSLKIGRIYNPRAAHTFVAVEFIDTWVATYYDFNAAAVVTTCFPSLLDAFRAAVRLAENADALPESLTRISDNIAGGLSSDEVAALVAYAQALLVPA